MGRKILKKNGKGGLPAVILFSCGFFLGILLPNLVWKLQWKQKALASVYLLGAFGGREVSGAEYLLEIVRMRGGYFFLCILCGFTVFGVPVAVLGMCAAGAWMGVLLAMSILQFGLAGGVVGLGLLFPQYLVYLPVMFIAMDMVYRESMGMWKNHGIFPQKIYRYAVRSLACMVGYFGGMILECYINPWVVERILSGLKFF